MDVALVCISTMVRFSCFNGHIHCHKPKKTVQHSVEAMQKTSEDFSQVQDPKSLNSSFLKAGDSQIGYAAKLASLDSVQHGWKSEEIKGKFYLEGDIGVNQITCIKKSQSLGSELYREGKAPRENDVDNVTDQGFSSESNEQNDRSRICLDGSKYPGESPSTQYQMVPTLESGFDLSPDRVNNECIFSVGDAQHSEKESCQYSDSPLAGDHANDPGNHAPHTRSVMVKSCSMPNIVDTVPGSQGPSCFSYLSPKARSADDLHVLDLHRRENSVHEIEIEVRQKQGRGDIIPNSGKNHFENFIDDGYDPYDYSALVKDWIVPVSEEIGSGKNQGESSFQKGDELSSKDFKIKRIEEWVNDLQHCTALVETTELPDENVQVKREPIVLNGSTTTKGDMKTTPGMEAAKKYISSLSASASIAQLANHGLVVIPFLSAFVSLRVLNLSGNSIARITAGALPRGLHMLNLSKNNISTIEGLRELTRLRVLDLSYNRIFRIGHGLASCSSLKELYLAGNKISEVEGLHRLLKLAVLDLRFNKISTAKCLGQLAANYNSLQAISLEGNPAQKNVGDEQLKKYLQGLLPHLTYYNRQPIKTNTLKDVTERSVRLGISSHQFDRSLRSEIKAARKSSHGVAVRRPSPSSATHGRKTQALDFPKRSKGRHGHGRLPPSGNRATADHHHHYFDFSSKIQNLRSELSIRRSRSEGTLGAP